MPMEEARCTYDWTNRNRQNVQSLKRDASEDVSAATAFQSAIHGSGLGSDVTRLETGTAL